VPRLTADEIEELLARDLVGHLATLDAAGYPHVTPIWFIWDGSLIRMTSFAHRPHLARIRADPRAGFVVDQEGALREDGERPNRQVRVVGRATIELDAGNRWTREIRRKYGAQAERPADAVLGPRCVITLTPEHLLALRSV
jgi:PPOX class probable F420-dependent enzyme